MDRLIKALQVYMYDQYDCPDVFEHDEDSLIEDIIYALVEKNEGTCPFCNYDCLGSCPTATVDCENSLKITCWKEPEIIWNSFIFNESEGE